MNTPEVLQKALRVYSGDEIQMGQFGAIKVLKQGVVVREFLSLSWAEAILADVPNEPRRPGRHCSFCGSRLRGNWCPECDPRELLYEI